MRGEGKVVLGGVVGTHTVDEDERKGFTSHINSVLEGDRDIGDRLPINLESMRVFDECRGELRLLECE